MIATLFSRYLLGCTELTCKNYRLFCFIRNKGGAG